MINLYFEWIKIIRTYYYIYPNISGKSGKAFAFILLIVNLENCGPVIQSGKGTVKFNEVESEI